MNDLLRVIKNQSAQLIMRTSVIIITSIVFFGQFILASPGFSQGGEKKLISLDFKNVSIQKVFAAIETKADVVIMYENTGSLKNEKVNISVKEKSVADVLDLLLKNKFLKWNIRENIIRIEAKGPDKPRSPSTSLLLEIQAGRTSPVIYIRPVAPFCFKIC